MAISPGTYDFTLQRGSDHKFNVVFKDSGGSAINLTGWTAAAQVWDEARTTKAADFAVTYVNRANNKNIYNLGWSRILFEDEDINIINNLLKSKGKCNE